MLPHLDCGPAAPLVERHVRLRAIIAALSFSVLSGCTEARYLAQAGCGQIDIMLRTRAREPAAADPHTPAHARELLAAVPEIKRFGELHGLRPTGSYGHYVQLDRGSVVYVVTASDPLQLRAKTWWFPIVGGVPYLGWFDREDARAFAAELRGEGLDTDLYGSEAYSTLGFFDDPVLSTMLKRGPQGIGSLADTVLHESVHATLFLDGQATFNESMAEFAAWRMAGEYLDERFGPGSAEKRAMAEEARRDDNRRREMHAAHEELTKLYASGRPVAEKLEEKRRIFADLRRRAGFRRPINNATLANFKNYNSGAGEFTALLGACGGSWPRFFAALSRLRTDRRAFTRRDQTDLGPILDPLVKAGCAPG